MIVLLLGAVSPLLLGFCLLRFLAPNRSLVLQLSFGAGIGAGLCSCLFFLSLVTGLPSLSLEALALIAAIALFSHGYIKARSTRARQTLSEIPWNTIDKVLGIAFTFACLAGLAGFLSALRDSPHGSWDAWAIWNTHARFLASPAWRDGFSPLLIYSHPDYPLLLPGLIARTWRAAGGQELTAPALAAAGFTCATVGVLVSSLAALKGRAQGLIAGILLVSTQLFVAHGASEYADVPAGFFLLSALAALALAHSPPQGSPSARGNARDLGWVLPGLAAGFAAWTKNEGWMLVLAFAALSLFALIRRDTRIMYTRRILMTAAGIAPILVIVLFFKYTFATANEFVGGRSLAGLTIALSNPVRYLRVGRGLFSAVDGFNGGRFLLPAIGTAICAFLTMDSPPTRSDHHIIAARLCVCVLAIVAAGYLATLIISPYDINWQVTTTLDRLLLQLLPACLFTAFLGMRTLR